MGFGGEGIGEITRMATHRLTGVLAPQASEGAFNLCKNSKLVKGKARYRRPEKLYGILLDRDVAGRVHRFQTVSPDAGMEKQSIVLQKASFQPLSTESSMKFGDIAGTKQKPSWYTCGANDLARISGDIQLMHDCRAAGDASLVAFAWLGQMCSASHCLLVKKVGTEAWYFAMGHISDSAVVVWPAILREVSGQQSGAQYAELDMSVDQVMLVPVLSATDWLAMSFRWRSPAWQNTTWSTSAGRLAPAVRAVVTGQPAPLLPVAASQAFWELDATWLRTLVAHLDVGVAPGDSLLQLLLSLITSILGVDIDAALQIARLRMASAEIESRFQAELLEVDDVHDVLDRNDIRVVESRQAVAATAKQQRKAFHSEFAKKVQERKATGQPPKKRARSTGASSASRPTKLPPLHEITQKEAKRFLPEGATLWQDRVRGGWHAHFPPWPRVSRSFQRYGQTGALQECYRYVWEKYCLNQGILVSACPMQGLFDAEGESAQDSGGVAAASSGRQGRGRAMRRRTARMLGAWSGGGGGVDEGPRWG